MKKITAIIASIAAILCIGGIGAYAYMNSNTFLINKYIKTCSVEAPNSPDYCKCKAYFNSEYNKDIFKQLAYADRIARSAIIKALPQDKIDTYHEKINRCFLRLSDEDFLAALNHPVLNLNECYKEAYNKLSAIDKNYVKTQWNNDKVELSNRKKFFYEYINRCMNSHKSDDELRNDLVYDFYIGHNKLPNVNQEKCINSLSRAEMEAINKGDIKELFKLEDCTRENRSIENILYTLAQAKILNMESEENRTIGKFEKERIQKQVVNCAEDMIKKLSDEELKKFKIDVDSSDIVAKCVDNKNP